MANINRRGRGSASVYGKKASGNAGVNGLGKVTGNGAARPVTVPIVRVRTRLPFAPGFTTSLAIWA
jgi:hypothetical protein